MKLSRHRYPDEWKILKHIDFEEIDWLLEAEPAIRAADNVGKLIGYELKQIGIWKFDIHVNRHVDAIRISFDNKDDATLYKLVGKSRSGPRMPTIYIEVACI